MKPQKILRRLRRTSSLALILGVGIAVVAACSATSDPRNSGGAKQEALAGQASALTSSAVDPGVRGGPAGAGGPLAGLTQQQLQAFQDGQQDFNTEEGVPEGLGPRFNGTFCGQCHSQPAIGGTSPQTNPQVAVATELGGQNTVPSFVHLNGPIVEMHLLPSGSEPDLFVITGRSDAPAACAITQPAAVLNPPAGGYTLRIPSPLFGVGLMEAIKDSTILAGNLPAGAPSNASLGITGHCNHAQDGTCGRSGWKAQFKTFQLQTANAYNVEMGVTNLLFPTEREEDPACSTGTRPEDKLRLISSPTAIGALAGLDDLNRFSNFQRFSAPPTPFNPGDGSFEYGQGKFISIGCANCHTPTLQTGNFTFAALSNQPVNLYSDLLVHHLGTNLADFPQVQAAADEFRTAPLWGVGQRIFFLHDGRTTDIVDAIEEHSSTGSEANQVIANFNNLSQSDQQAIVNFLRDL